jgi:hypothetical protein
LVSDLHAALQFRDKVAYILGKALEENNLVSMFVTYPKDCQFLIVDAEIHLNKMCLLL